jgi:predicted RecA/RadA family phage recombinase
MATNITADVGPRRSFQYTNSGSVALSSGDPVLMTNTLGVAIEAIAVGATGTVVVDGVTVTLAKVSAQAWTQGQQLYWSSASDSMTSTAGTNTPCGKAAAAAANPSSTGSVCLNLA